MILIDTGYLFPETYQFIEQLTQAALAEHPDASPARRSVAEFEAQHGKLWEQGREGLDQYLELRKVEPMRRALATLGTQTWFAGLRRSQAESRAKLNPLEVRDGRFKVHPIFDWSDRDVYLYLKAHGLCRITRCGTRDTSRSATGTPPRRCTKWNRPKNCASRA